MKTAEVAIIFILGSLILLVFVFFLVLIVMEYRKKQVRHITEKLELKHRYQNEVLQTQLEVQEQSFKYISEEIHDNIAQTLSLVKLRLYKTAGKAGDITMKESIENSTELLTAALDGLRNLSHVLNGGLIAKLSLRESIEKELNYVHDANDTQVQLSVKGQYYEPDSEKKLLIFRIVQEAINNAVKHGKASAINISLAYQTGNLVIEIKDNGKGFDTTLLQDSKGLGLHNMQLRAQMLGSMEVISSPGAGSTITLNIDTNGR